MSRLLKRKFQGEHKMPDFKVMGSVNDDICKLMTDMAVNRTTDNAQTIVTAVTRVLKADINNMMVDAYVEPFETNWIQRMNYQQPTGIFYLISEGTATIKFPRKEISLVPGSVMFIDERQTFKVLNNTNTRVSLMSGRFTWDKDVHGVTS